MTIPITQPVTVPAVEELTDSPTFTWNRKSGQTGHRKFKVPWLSLAKFCGQMLGGPSSNGIIYYPQTFPGFPKCYVDYVEFRPFPGAKISGSGMDAVYSWATVDVYYSTRRMLTNSQGYFIEERFEGASQLGTFPNSLLYYGTGTPKKLLPDGSRVTYLVGLVSWNYTVKQLPSVPANLFSFRTSVNQAAVTSIESGVAFEAETVLFQEPSAVETVNSDGDPAWDINFKFLVHDRGWNKTPIPQAGSDEAMWVRFYTSDSAGDSSWFKKFPLKDFTQITT